MSMLVTVTQNTSSAMRAALPHRVADPAWLGVANLSANPASAPCYRHAGPALYTLMQSTL
jgi:hypothetical protein